MCNAFGMGNNICKGEELIFLLWDVLQRLPRFIGIQLTGLALAFFRSFHSYHIRGNDIGKGRKKKSYRF